MDRGAWGLEVLVLLAALKLALPDRVLLLRGNHESSTCTQLYGFRTEVFRKYGNEVNICTCTCLGFPATPMHLQESNLGTVTITCKMSSA